MVVSESELDTSVAELRSRLGADLAPGYDTDFNLKRWIINADKLSKSTGNVALAERQLRHHLRFRHALGLDGSVPSWDENPVYKDRLLPRGHFEWIASRGCFLWWVDYSTLNMTALIHSQKSTDFLIYHFWKYERMLRMINEKEHATGLRCHVYAVIDLRDWPINPLTLLFVNDGQMSYYANLFHYDHYPELVSPINMINAPTWLSLPYNLVKSTMPKDFAARFRILNHRYADTIFKELPSDLVAVELGGSGRDVKPFYTLPSRFGRHGSDSSGQQVDGGKQVAPPSPDTLHHVQVYARRRKLIPVECSAGCTLSWRFSTDHALMFGVFYQRQPEDGDEYGDCAGGGKADLDQMTMVYPMLRFAAKHVQETGSLQCAKAGVYYLVFCNKSSWLSRRHIYISLELRSPDGELDNNNALLLHRSLSG